MNRNLRKLVPCLLATLILPACTIRSSEGDPEPAASATSESSASSSTSSSSSSSGTGGSGNHVTGSGNLKTEQRTVEGFDEISFSGIGELSIEQTGTESLAIEAEDNLLPLLVSEVSGSRLRIGVRQNSSISATRPITFRLSVKSLRAIEATGAGRVEATGLSTPALQVTSSGSVKSAVAGRAEEQTIEVSGTASFDGGELAGRTGEVQASGTAEVLVNVSGELAADASGTAVIRYLGNPRVTQETSGLGKVEKAQ